MAFDSFLWTAKKRLKSTMLRHEKLLKRKGGRERYMKVFKKSVFSVLLFNYIYLIII